jgi:hypothetical protein
MAKTLALEWAQSNLRVTVARALAAALITGIDNAASEGRPLTQVQQIDVATMHLMAYAAGVEEGERTLEVEADLSRVSQALHGCRHG